jgi:phosphoribosyl-ATP pyrophosphohydrolase/phosphoribosyl-AMP cyclohydrolase
VRPDFSKNQLIAAVIQDTRTGRVRMVGYMNEEAYDRTVVTGDLHFFSRSRGALWRKGETSGNVHRVTAMRMDCDGDALLVMVEPSGATCHTGEDSCFFTHLHGLASSSPTTVSRLEEVIADRKANLPEGSYTADLLRGGVARVARKVGEEAVEVLVAALSEDEGRLVEESADLIYHLLVLLGERGVRWERVCGELEGRTGGMP